MTDDPADRSDEVTFGSRPSKWPLAGFRGPNARAGVIAGAIACLAILTAVVAFAVESHSRPQQPAEIEVLNGNTVGFRLQEASGAALMVQYLRSDHGPPTIWITLAVSGLPPRIGYVATGGECLKSHPRTLARSSGLPDPRTKILILSLNNMPAQAIIWVKVANVRGIDLGGIRSPFLAPHGGVPIAPGLPACP